MEQLKKAVTVVCFRSKIKNGVSKEAADLYIKLFQYTDSNWLRRKRLIVKYRPELMLKELNRSKEDFFLQINELMELGLLTYFRLKAAKGGKWTRLNTYFILIPHRLPQRYRLKPLSN